MGDWLAVGVGVVGVGLVAGVLLGVPGLGDPVGDGEPEDVGVVEDVGVLVGGTGAWVARARSSRWAMHSRALSRSPITMLRADSSDSAGIVARTCSW